MIGCMIVGGLVALGIAKIARHHFVHPGWGCGGMRHTRYGGFGRHWGADGGGGPEDWWSEAGPGDGSSRHGWWGHRSPWGSPFGHGPGRAFILGAVLRRLETTPTQNEALRAAAKEFQESARAAKGEAGRTRADLAAALRQSFVDAEAMGEMFARHDSALDGLRKAFVGLTMKVHGILDETQRERFAQLIERGPRWFRRSAAPTW